MILKNRKNKFAYIDRKNLQRVVRLEISMIDQGRISSYNIHTISSTRVMRIKKSLNWGIIRRSKTKSSKLKITRIL